MLSLRASVLCAALLGCGGGKGGAPASSPISPAAPVPDAEPPSAREEAAPDAAGIAEDDASADSAAPEGEVAQSDPAPDPEPGPPPELPKGTTILHIGDSFAGALGIDLNRELKKAGVRGVLKYETSSYIPTWAWGKELDKHLWSYRPDLVIITLGANELEVEDPTIRIKTIKRLVSRVGDRPCVWIGVPLWEGARGVLLDVIRENCAPCIYMDSVALLPDLPRARDKIHPSMPARKTWAAFVVDWLARQRDPQPERPWNMKAP